MRKPLILLVLVFSLSACKSKKRAVITKKDNTQTVSKTTKIPTYTKSNYESIAGEVVDYALEFDGVKYKYGGTTKKGMDCSGLVFASYKKFDILLPRTTTDLAKHGNWIDLKEVKPGDLLFFATRKNSRTVNHVGIVTNSSIGNVEFLHASTSNGVMVSNLAERYWYFAFVQARRVL